MSLAGQLIANGVIAGAIYALVASGFSLIYNVTKMLHFAHGAVLALGAYFVYTLADSLPFPLAVLITLLTTCIAGELINRFVYRPLRTRKASSAVLLIASLAVMIFVNAFILAVWGADIKTVPLGLGNSVFDIGGVLITGLQLTMIGVSLVLLLALWWLMTKTRLGKAMRALADNKDIAQTVGINPEKIYTLTFIIGSLLAAIAGMLIGIEQNLQPTMGVNLIIKGFTGAVIGGMFSVPGAVLGAFVVGLAENIGIWWLPSGYKDAITFALLFAFLLFRPQGILGKKLREA
jgi:branched-chain amino acid transport system permease protein